MNNEEKKIDFEYTLHLKKMTSTSHRLSLSLQDLAAKIQDQLKAATGDNLGFVLVISADNVAQYVSNVERKDGEEILQSLLDRWRARRAAIPAHYNPDLKTKSN